MKLPPFQGNPPEKTKPKVVPPKTTKPETVRSEKNSRQPNQVGSTPQEGSIDEGQTVTVEQAAKQPFTVTEQALSVPVPERAVVNPKPPVQRATNEQTNQNGGSENPSTEQLENTGTTLGDSPKVTTPPIQPSPNIDPIDGVIDSNVNSDLANSNPPSVGPKTVIAITIPILFIAFIIAIGFLVMKKRNRINAAANGPSRLNSAMAKVTSISSWFNTHERGKDLDGIFTNHRVPVLGISWLQPKLARYTRKVNSWFETHLIVEPAQVNSNMKDAGPVALRNAEVITTLTKIRAPNSIDDGNIALNSKNEDSFFVDMSDNARAPPQIKSIAPGRKNISTALEPISAASSYLWDIVSNLRQKSFNFPHRP